jgi:hypothetical protein
VVVAEAHGPIRKIAAERGADGVAHGELDAVALAVVEADGFDMGEAVERPGEAGSRILAAGKQHQRARVEHR